MSKAMQLVGIILLGIFTLVIVNLMNDVRSTNELDYYLLQEVTEASMYDAVDYSYYRETGLLKVDRDMFLESFNRRFAQSVAANRDYDIKIIDFNETPPKASIEVTTPTVATVKGEVALITNRVNGIIETIYDDLVMSRGDGSDINFMDVEPPTITIDRSNGCKIVVKDNIALSKFKIMTVGDNSNIEDVYKSISSKQWTTFNDYRKSHTVDCPGSGSYYIFAEDTSGNWISNSDFIDIPPIFKTITLSESNTKLSFTIYDDNGIKGYKLSTNSNDYSTTGFTAITTKKLNGNNLYSVQASASVSISRGTYYLYAIDSKNQVVRSKPIGVTSFPTIVVDNNNKTITFNDADGDLDKYVISSSDVTPTSGYTSISGNSAQVSISTYAPGNYYVFVYDKSGNLGTSALTISSSTKILVSTTNPVIVAEECMGVNSGWCIPNKTPEGYVKPTLTVDTNTYSTIEINVSKMEYYGLEGPLNCSCAGVCHYSFIATIGDKKYEIQDWNFKHKEDIKPGKTFENRKIVLDLNELGIKNTGNQILSFTTVDDKCINGNARFDATINSVTLK